MAALFIPAMGLPIVIRSNEADESSVGNRFDLICAKIFEVDRKYLTAILMKQEGRDRWKDELYLRLGMHGRISLTRLGARAD